MRYYTVKEASLILGFSTNSIYKFCLTGRLKANRGNSKSGRFKIPHSSLEKFLGTPLAEAAITDALVLDAVSSTQIKKETDVYQPRTVSTVVPVTTGTKEDTPLPLTLTRVMILFGLLLILIDLLVSSDFSLFQQILRLSLMGILIILTYQFGGLSHSA